MASTPHQQTFEDVVVSLGSDATSGLTTDEALRRLDEYGRNALEEEAPTPAWRRVLAQFMDPLVVVLLVATVVSTVLWLVERDTTLPFESIAILAVVLLNAVMGYLQESRAAAAVAALRKLSATNALVIRDGERQRIDVELIVPGDIIVVEEGDTIPADARSIALVAFETSEAALTGESHPVPKSIAPIERGESLGDRRNMLFSGTAVTRGHGSAVVTATGMSTEMGAIAGMLRETEEEQTPLQRELARLGKRLGLIVIAIAVVMIATIVIVEEVRSLEDIVTVFILGVALAVAAVPEGLPAVVTAVLSIGVQRMARRNAIVRNLAAVETLGSASVIASDKTGTLTRNEMTVRTIVTASGRVQFSGTGYSPDGEVATQDGSPIDGSLRSELIRTLSAADRANNAVLQGSGGTWTVQGDPTEGALVVAARKAGIETEELESRHARIGEVPFSSERKLMSTVHSDSEQPELAIVFTKGAPDVLVDLCTHELVDDAERPLDAARRAAIKQTNDELASEALRTLGIALRVIPRHTFDPETADETIENEMVFLGLIGMIDPPRDEAVRAVSRAKHAGIRVVMITGDHPATASVIARELGISIDEHAVIGAELATMDDRTLDETVARHSVYARVNPEHKLRIVDAAQRNGDIVAMTGDGVNDAPALKSADIGVAMGITGTDVSKEAADIVIADDNFATIVAAVEEGRAIFDNIRKFLRFLLSSNIGEVMTMFFGVVLSDLIDLHEEGVAVVLPILATQILWTNLVTDGAPALALGLDPPEPDLMNRRPRPRSESVITHSMWRGIFLFGAIMCIATLLVLDASLPGGLINGTGDLAHAQTMAFTTLVLCQVFNVLNARSETRSAFAGMFANKWLNGAIVMSIALQIAVVHVPWLRGAFGTVPMTTRDWLICTAAASSMLWCSEVIKIVLRARQKREQIG